MYVCIGKFGVVTYLILNFSLLVKSMEKFIQDMVMDLSSSRLNPTQIKRPIRCG